MRVNGKNSLHSIETLVLMLALVALSLITATQSHMFGSDAVAQQNIVATLSPHSHPTIDLPQNTYIVKLPLYSIVAALPISPATGLLLTILVLGLSAIALFYWSAGILTDKPKVVWTLTGPLLWLASLSGGFVGSLINPNSRNLELGLAFVIFAILARWYKAGRPLDSKATFGLALSFVLLVGLLFYDDPYFEFVLAAPLVLFFGGRWLLFGKEGKALLVACSMVSAVIAAQAWHWVFWQAGVHSGAGEAVFATLPEVGRNLQLFVSGALDVFNANFFGQPVLSMKALTLVLNFLVLMVTILSPLLLLMKKFRHDAWKTFFVLQPLFISLAFIFSSVPVDLGSERYLVILPFYSVLITTLILIETAGRIKTVLIGTLVVAVALNVAATVQMYIGRGTSPHIENEVIARTVERLDLTKGYASYWDAGINQYYTDSRVLFIQSVCTPKAGVKLSRYLVNEQEWNKTSGKSFYLLDPEATKCRATDLTRFFGEPERVVAVTGGKQLFIYGYDISTHITR